MVKRAMFSYKKKGDKNYSYLFFKNYFLFHFILKKNISKKQQLNNV